MRYAWLVLLLFAADALAHGGGFREPNHGVPPGLRVPPPPPCFCAGVECTKCFASQLAADGPLVESRITATQLERCNDFARLRIQAVYRAKERTVEAYTQIEPAGSYGDKYLKIVKRKTS